MSGTKPTPGVTITLTGDASDSVVTDANGEFSFGLPDGSYVLTPSKGGHQFTPASANVEVSGADDTGNDFTAEGVYTISGTITGDEVEGVTVALTGDATDSTTSAADGTYSFTGVVDGSYTVTPTLAGYTFAPADASVTVSGADDTGNDFVSSLITAFYIESGWEDGTSVPDISASGDWDNISIRASGAEGTNPLTITNIATPTVNTHTPSQSRSLLLATTYEASSGHTTGIRYNNLSGLNINMASGVRMMTIFSRTSTGDIDSTLGYLSLRNSDGSVLFMCGFENFGGDTVWVREKNPTDGEVQSATNLLNYPDTTAIWCAVGLELPAGLTGTMKTRFYYNADNTDTLYEASRTMSVAYDYSGFTPDNIEFIAFKNGTADVNLCWIWVGSLTDDWPI